MIQTEPLLSIEIAWARVAVAAGLLATLALVGGVEYHIGIEKVGDALFNWTERICLLFVGLFIGEALARINAS
ncbi:MAG: hypothetical protein WB992_11490 [Bryobacteraceae bacterium]